jgi:tetratricopeptide (TPR) repeat protein
MLSGFAAGQTNKQKRQAKEHYDEGTRAYLQKNYQAAVDKYTQSIEIIPVNAAAHFWKGNAYYQLKDYEKALYELDIAMTQGYKPLDVYTVRSMAKYDKNDLDGALADFHEGLKLDPNNLTFLVGVADINFRKGNFKESLAAFQLALAQAPQNADLYYSVARVQSSLGNVQGQASAAEEAVKRNTRFIGDAYFLLGDAYRQLRRHTDAADAFERSINVKPDNLEAYRSLADVYRSLSRFNDAIDVTKKGLRLFPNNGTLYTDISWYYSLADRNQEAIEAAKAGVQLLPTQSLAYTNLCRAYNDTGQYQLAMNACNAALRISPDDGETYFYLGRAHDLAGKTTEAPKYYGRAVTGLEEFVKVRPDYSDGYYLLGNAYFATGRTDKAIEAYLKCLELSPRFVRARYNLGIIQLRSNNKTAALEQYNSLLPLDPALAAKLKMEIDKL